MRTGVGACFRTCTFSQRLEDEREQFKMRQSASNDIPMSAKVEETDRVIPGKEMADIRFRAIKGTMRVVLNDQ